MFKVGDTIIYENGIRTELGTIKEVLPNNKYRVWYHTGSTSAVTDESLMKEISNLYAFTVIRHSVDYSIEDQQARRYASNIMEKILEKLPEKFQKAFDGTKWYEIEDAITDLLEEGNIL